MLPVGSHAVGILTAAPKVPSVPVIADVDGIAARHNIARTMKKVTVAVLERDLDRFTGRQQPQSGDPPDKLHGLAKFVPSHS